jgi:hypothetical protein
MIAIYTKKEVELLIALVARHDPELFVSDEAKSLIYKAKATMTNDYFWIRIV